MHDNVMQDDNSNVCVWKLLYTHCYLPQVVWKISNWIKFGHVVGVYTTVLYDMPQPSPTLVAMYICVAENSVPTCTLNWEKAV